MLNYIMTILERYSPDIELIGSGNTDYGHYLAEQVINQKENKKLEKRAELDNYFAFVNAVDKSRINIENIFANRYEKENLIKKYTPYAKLNGSGDKKELLKNCSDYKIGSAFNNIYYSALNKIEKYGWGK